MHRFIAPVVLVVSLFVAASASAAVKKRAPEPAKRVAVAVPAITHAEAKPWVIDSFGQWRLGVIGPS
jgi:hypothetical protein